MTTPEVSGSLPTRLVELGAEKIADRNKHAWKHSDETQYRRESRDVLAAALRLLACELGVGSIDGDGLEALAVSIEKGEQT